MAIFSIDGCCLHFYLPEETITAYVSGDKPGNYVYTIKTGKLKKQ